MPHELQHLFLFRGGRIGRGPYWLGVAGLMAASFVLGLIPVAGPWLALALLWPWFCLLSKRLRDIERDPRLSAAALAPLALSSLLGAAMSLTLVTPASALAVLPLVGLLGAIALIAALVGAVAVIWIGVTPTRRGWETVEAA